MKTLKQNLWENAIVQARNWTEIDIEIITQTVKEWLTQKRQEKEKTAKAWGKQDQELVKSTLEYLQEFELNELLEELKQ